MIQTVLFLLLTVQIGLCKSAPVACGDNFNGTSGSFALNINTPETTCTWNIRVEAVKNATLKHIFFFFDDLYLDDRDEVLVAELAEQNPTVLFMGNQDGFSYISNALIVTLTLQLSKEKLPKRVFRVIYDSKDCIMNLQKSSGILKPPVAHKKVSKVNCSYTTKFGDDNVQYLSFSKTFDVGNSVLTVHDGNSPKSPKILGTFTGSPQDLPDIISTSHALTVKAEFDMKSNLFFKGHFAAVTKDCSFMINVDGGKSVLQSPNYPHTYPQEETDCRWIFKLQGDSNVFSVNFLLFDLADSFDAVEIKDGNRKDAPVLAYLTNQTYSSTQQIYSSGKSLWIRFSTDSGNTGNGFNGRITPEQFGGYFKKSGDIGLKAKSLTSDKTYVFMLETEKNTQVQLSLGKGTQELFPKSQLWIYDGYDTKSSQLLDSLVSDRQFYDVISPSNKMMVLAKNFGPSNSFQTSFKGIPYGYHNISVGNVGIKTVDSLFMGNLSWVIRPHLIKNDDRIISLTIVDLVLKGKDQIKICKLDDCVAPVVLYNATNSNKATIHIDILFGIKIEIQRTYKHSSVVTVFSASYEVIPACKKAFNLTKANPVTIETLNFPNNYPLNSKCQWTLNIPHNKGIHFTFKYFNTLPNHYINFSTPVNRSVMNSSGDALPTDLIINGTDTAIVKFLSPIQVLANSASGFQFVASVIDCGSVETLSSGTFGTPGYPKKIMKPILCVWKVTVPWVGKQGKDSHQYISFSTNLDPSSNYSILDGGSINDPKVANVTAKKGGQSLRNMVIVVYNKTDNKSEPGITFNYQASSCPKSRQCGNGMCIHDSWVCDGIGQCPDFADERNCTPKPAPVNITHGVGTYVPILCSVLSLLFGIGLAIFGPMAYRKYKTGHAYSSFSNIPVVTDT